MASKKLTHDEHIKIAVLHKKGYSTVESVKRIKHSQSSVPGLSKLYELELLMIENIQEGPELPPQGKTAYW